MKKPELISPAGTLEKLKIAFEFGADAVYAGVPDFSMRARINEFTYGKMAQGVKYAHERGKKIYATINIYAHNKHIKKIENAIKKYADIGVDALVISDPGILKIARKAAPKMTIHLSTQANCTNYEAAKFWYEQGVKRIVLAREVSLKEITEIHTKIPKIELECFVHGAMCMAYSGRCILSKWLTERSANLGECAQPCRWEYELVIGESGCRDKALPCSASSGIKENGGILEEDQHGTYIFNSKDLCLIEHLDKLYKAGVTSFKIEGRTKSAYYAAVTAKLYREGIDKIPLVPFKKGGKRMYALPKGWKKEIQKIRNRGYTTGFLFGEEKCEHNFERSHEECKWQFAGEVIKSSKFKVQSLKLWKEAVFVKAHNALYVRDEIEFVASRGENIKMKIKKMYDAKNLKEIKEAHGGQGQAVIIPVEFDIPVMSMVRRKVIRM
ncbi:MAG: U32 family peptidase C-terminal domain-containing protein [bacterium]